jgi:drug/metabolite transporter (DMT)-like permease
VDIRSHPGPLTTARRAVIDASAARRGLALAFATAAISGVAVWLNAFGVKQVPDPVVYTTLKNVVAAVILLSLLSASGGFREARALSRRGWAKLAVIGVVGGSVPFVLFFSGLAQSTAPGAAFIHKTLFVWVALLAVPILGERLGLAQVAAMAVLLGGQLLLAPPKLDGASWSVGETMIAAATLLWAVEVILVKRLLGSLSSSLVGAMRLGLGSVVLIAWVAVTGSLGAILELEPQQIAWVVLTGAVLAAYVATWFAALRLAPASIVSSVLVVGAVITTVLQAVAAGELPAIPVSVGSAVVLVAAVAVGLPMIRLRTSRAVG